MCPLSFFFRWKLVQVDPSPAAFAAEDDVTLASATEDDVTLVSGGDVSRGRPVSRDDTGYRTASAASSRSAVKHKPKASKNDLYPVSKEKENENSTVKTAGGGGRGRKSADRVEADNTLHKTVHQPASKLRPPIRPINNNNGARPRVVPVLSPAGSSPRFASRALDGPRVACSPSKTFWTKPNVSHVPAVSSLSYGYMDNGFSSSEHFSFGSKELAVHPTPLFVHRKL